MDYLNGHNVIIRVLYKGGRRVRVRKGDTMTKREIKEGERKTRRCHPAGSEDGKRVHEPKNVGGF